MLRGKKVILRPVDIEKDFERCWQWINDFEIMQFLGKPYRPITREKERELLRSLIEKESSVAFAIDTFGGTHIGMTNLGNISHFDGTAFTGTLIGDKQYLGRGYGTDAKMMLLWHAFKVLNLRRINSHVLSSNPRSIRCQLKCGYEIEGIKRKEVYKNGRYCDLVLLAVFRRGWFKRWHAYMKS